jgi:5-formyltetrahydrofolate cyclo-ligase
MPALMAMDRCGISVAVPVLETRRPPTMHFRLWSPAEALRDNAVGIAEPESGTRIDIGELDIVLLPLVAWSPAGARLGMGGGYYDRILSGVGGEGPRRFGIAYDCQKVEDVPREPWDEPLHGIITESGWRPLPDRNQDRNQDQDRDKDGD